MVAQHIAGRNENECVLRWNRHGKHKLREKSLHAMLHPHDPHHFGHSNNNRGEFEQMQQLEHNYKHIVTPYGAFRLHRLNQISSKQDLDQVMVLGIGPMIQERNFVPPRFHQLLSCSPIKKGYWRFWWRSIAAAYFIRPNSETLQLIAKYRDVDIHNSHGHCISTYVRHGDKDSEMKLVPFVRYAETANEIWNQQYLFEDLPKSYSIEPQWKQNKLFYYGTETLSIVTQATAWKQDQHINVHTSELTQLILDSRKNGQIHANEYLSYLVNLENIIKCRISICTYLSNFCRVVDELRVTVGGKANRYYAEVNVEMCPTGKFCIKKNHLIEDELVFKDLDPRLW